MEQIEISIETSIGKVIQSKLNVASRERLLGSYLYCAIFTLIVIFLIRMSTTSPYFIGIQPMPRKIHSKYILTYDF